MNMLICGYKNTDNIDKERRMAKLKDVAKLANVSVSTVSRILNNDTSLSVTDKTKNEVLNAARQLNYPIKQKEKRTTFAIIQWFSQDQEISDPYYLTLRRGAESFLKKNNIAVRRFFHDDLDMDSTLSQIDGILCLGKFSKKYIDKLKKYTQRIILLDMTLYPCREVSIVLDFDDAVKQVIQYLYIYGHRKIGYLGGIEFVDQNQEIYEDPRKESFIKYCKKFNIQYENYILEDKFSSESGYKMMTDMIYSQNLPTAIFAASDPIAIGALRALQDNGYKVPDDISIIGFDNIETVNFTNPPLTTVHSPSFDMGVLGAKILYYNISNQSESMSIRIQMPCFLIERNSVKNINSSK